MSPLTVDKAIEIVNDVNTTETLTVLMRSEARPEVRRAIAERIERLEATEEGPVWGQHHGGYGRE